MNYFNKIQQEKFINTNCKLKNCYEKCIEKNKNEYIIKESYKIRNKIYYDFDDLKFNQIQFNCFNNCINE